MKRKTLLKAMFLGIAMVLMMAPLAMASVDRMGEKGDIWVYLTNYSSPFPDGTGGEFKAHMHANTGKQYDILTFCLEKNEHLAVGKKYSYEISNGAIGGGVGGASGGVDNISVGTSFLYSQFISGQLADYFTDRKNAAKQLQIAIWYLEDELTSQEKLTLDVAHNRFLLLLGDYDAKKVDAMVGENGVYVLNLKEGLENRQSLLVSAVPEPGSMLLIGIGLMGLALARRKSTKS